MVRIKISRAEFKRRMPIGKKVRLSPCVSGRETRVVQKHQSNAIVFKTEADSHSWLYYKPGDTYFQGDGVLEVEDEHGHHLMYEELESNGNQV